MSTTRTAHGSPSRRRLSCFAASAAAAIVLAACGGTSVGGSGSPTGNGKGKVGGSVVYTWWGAGERNQKTQAVISLYEKAHPGVTVQGEPSDFTSYFQKRNVEAAAQNLPCVPQMQARELSDYTSRHALMPLDGMIRSGAINVSEIPKSVLDTGRGADGKLYMLPTGAAYDGILYNTRLARLAGVGDLPPHATWAQWQDWLLRASKKLPHGVYAAQLDGGLGDLFIAYVQSEGQQLFSPSGQLGFSEPTLINFWNMWEKLRKAGATVPASTAADVGQSAAEDQTPVMQGTAMSESAPGNWLVGAQPLVDAHGGGTLKVSPYPYGPHGIGNVLITSGLSISANCNNVPTAASFINFFANNAPAAKVFSSDNGAVTNTALLRQQEADPKQSAGFRLSLQVYQQILNAGAPLIRYPSGYSTLFADAFNQDYQNISFGKVSVKTAADAFFRQAKSDLQQ